MTTTLITGANKGIGFEAARQLAAAGHQVWIGGRDVTRGQRAADALAARFVQLDVTDDASVAEAVKTVGALDVLVNNAGISGGRISPGEATADHMRAVYETNVFGPVRVLHTFIPLLERSPGPVIVNVSSGLGSFGLASDPDGPWAEFNVPVYSSSKAALNMLTLQYAMAFRECGSTRSTPATPPPTSTPTEARRPSNKEPRRSSGTHGPPPKGQPAASLTQAVPRARSGKCSSSKACRNGSGARRPEAPEPSLAATAGMVLLPCEDSPLRRQDRCR
jgi:NAD(P)-dependent dehydrogenase (short-subunit alcohol dehydrogenase family)